MTALLSARPCYEGAVGCPICVLWNFCSPQSMHDGREKNKKRGRGKGSGRESLGGEEGGETGKPSIRRTGCASQSEARSEAAAAEPRSLARRSAEPARGSPRTSAASASTGKVPSMMLVN